MTNSNQSAEQAKSKHLKTIQLSKDSCHSPFPYISGQKKLEHSQSFNYSFNNSSSTTSRSPYNNPLKGNIENFIGYTQVPLGLAGPLLIDGDEAQGEFHIPLATTEGALVASYSRGMKVSRLSGGIKTTCIQDRMERAPYFQFEDARKAREFEQWISQQADILSELVSTTSNYCQLKSLDNLQEGRGLILKLNYKTGDAAGQNMVTLTTNEICQYIINKAPIKPTQWYIEANHSGDKKAQSKSLTQTRGKKVIAEVTLKRAYVRSILKSTPEAMSRYFLNSTLATLQAGAIGNCGHVANALTALFLACGQDVACVAESSPGLLRMEVTQGGDLYTALSLPSLVVGTVGGGTQLKTQAEALEMIDCLGAGKAKKFAELCCATALVGEISIAAAIAEKHFAKAHKILGRR